MAAAAIFDLDFGTQIDIGYTRVTVAHNPNFCKIQDGGSGHLEFGVWTISLSRMKVLYCKIWYVDKYWNVTMAQYSIFSKIQDGGVRHLIRYQ